MNHQPRLGELGERGKEVYEKKLKHLLEPVHKGRFVAVEPDTESYFLGKTGTEAMLKARGAMPDKLFFLARIGYATADTIGGYGLRNRDSK